MDLAAPKQLPARAYALMTDAELKLLGDHGQALVERKRRKDRKQAKRERNLLALRETAAPKGGKTKDLQLLIEQVFTT